MKIIHVVARALLLLSEAIPVTMGRLLRRQKARAAARNDILSFFLLSSFLLSSCTPATQPPSQTEVITIYATPAAEPWMSDLFACANDLSVTLNVSAESPEIYLRLGEPETLLTPAYQIDEEEILIVTNRESPVQNLSLQEAQDLFAQGNDSAQVWVYSSEADVQILFDQLVMKGRSVTSFARMAAGPQEMSDALISESNSVGILSKRWMSGSLREVYSVGIVPVLTITQAEPQGAVGELISCLQND
ncbi:MAG: hypothetical protein HZB18_12810 [Chloroflexi bacterium]|nr:hypothetical protein [Chloroflexota bacterium]